MADKQVKVVGKHTRGCYALKNEREGVWDTCWGPIAWGHYGEPVVQTWRHYGKNGRKLRTWVRFICNNGGCKAELHVESDFILRSVERTARGKER